MRKLRLGRILGILVITLYITLSGCGEMTGDSGGKITSAGSDMTGPTTTNVTTGGSTGGGNTQGGSTSQSAVPAGVSAAEGNGQVTITWNAVSGATLYNLYWSTSSGVTKTNGTKILNAATPYIHTGRTNGITYYYAVTAVTSSGESSESAQVQATPSTNPTPAPTITGFTPTSGPVGAEVTITGTNFSTTPSENTVKFNDTTATPTSATATQIVATVPTGATTGSITVTTMGGIVTSSTSFTVTSSTSSASLRVRVVDSNKNKVANAAVVLGNPDGTMITYGYTDANGEIVFNDPPPNATVTTTISHLDGSPTNYYLRSIYDVNVSAVSLDVPSFISDPGTVSIGTANINLTSSVSGVTTASMILGSGYYSSMTILGSTNLSVYPTALQSDGKVSFVALGYDLNNNLLGYGAVLDQTFTDGMNVNLPINQTNFNNVTHSLSNIPATAKGYYFSEGIRRKGVNSVWINKSGTTPIPAYIDAAYIPNFGDSFTYSVNLEIDQNNNGTPESRMYMRRSLATPASQNFDFSQGPPLPSNLSISGAGTATPTFSWDANSTATDFIHISLFDPTATSYNYQFTASPNRGSIVFPQLPDTLASFRPFSTNRFMLLRTDGDYLAGYNDTLTKMDQHYGGTWSQPAEGIEKQSFTSFP